METLLLLVFITAVIEVLIGFVLIALYGEKRQKMRAMELEMLLEARSKPNIQGEQRKQLEERLVLQLRMISKGAYYWYRREQEKLAHQTEE